MTHELLEAVAHRFKAAILQADDSLWAAGTPIWQVAQLQSLAQVLAMPRKAGSTLDFEADLRQQLASTAPATLQLAAELLTLVLLLARIEPTDTRHSLIAALGVPLPADLAETLQAAVEPTAASFLNLRRAAVSVLLDTVRGWKQLPAAQQQQMLADPWAFKLWLYARLPGSEAPMREALLFLAHPHTFRPLLTVERKQQVAAAYAGYVQQPTSDLDQQLDQIWRNYTRQHGTPPDLLHLPALPTPPPPAPAPLRSRPTADDLPLPHLPAALLAERIAELQRDLLVDRTTLIRIYRALVAGQHVILSGPPGTGKTHLAVQLPRVLWRDPHTGLDGYAADLVTATEDWSVRHLLGGIVPHLHTHNGEPRMLYRVQHGYLARAVLANYHGYAGYNRSQIPATFYRQPYTDAQGQRCRGCWLVIDELTRAPIDAAFGSLLTSLGGQAHPLLLPSDDGDVAVPMPRDFRIIGTLNSFDRHFLHQISEALKRRFVFIDLLPPTRAHAAAEHALALAQACQQLHSHAMPGLTITGTGAGTAIELAGVVQLQRGNGGATTWQVQPADDAVADVLDTCRGLFTAIRVYRRLGTAQVQALYRALLTGQQSGLDWQTALDAALADTLADQLQVLMPDEVQILLAMLQAQGDAAAFTAQMHAFLDELPLPRRETQLAHLHAALPLPATADSNAAAQIGALEPGYLAQVFVLPQQRVPLADGLFAQRLRQFVSSNGL